MKYDLEYSPLRAICLGIRPNVSMINAMWSEKEKKAYKYFFYIYASKEFGQFNLLLPDVVF